MGMPEARPRGGHLVQDHPRARVRGSVAHRRDENTAAHARAAILESGTAIWYCHLVLPSGTAIWCCHLVLPSGIAIWYCHLVLPFGTAIWSPGLMGEVGAERASRFIHDPQPISHACACTLHAPHIHGHTTHVNPQPM